MANSLRGRVPDYRSFYYRPSLRGDSQLANAAPEGAAFSAFWQG
jgi:hypothetical protein